MLGNSRKLRRLNTHRSRQHSNSSNWDNSNLDTDDFYETNLTNNQTCPCSSNTSSSSSRQVLSIGNCARIIHQIDNSMKLTCSLYFDPFLSYIKRHNNPKYGNLSRNFHIYLTTGEGGGWGGQIKLFHSFTPSLGHN